MMGDHKVFQMSFPKVYGLLVSKAEKKGRAKAEVDSAARWLRGIPSRRWTACWRQISPTAIFSAKRRGPTRIGY